MKAKYRLLALDLDDTLLTKNKQISKEDKKWINIAREAGVTVILATGRGIQRVEYILDELDFRGPMVLVNGAEVWAEKGKLLKRHYIRKEDIQKLYYLALEADVHFWGYSVESFTGKKDWTEEMLERRWMKFGMHDSGSGVIKKLREEGIKLKNIDITRSASINMEVSLKGISKESGVRNICDYLDIKMEEVMAIGDNMNDYHLIKSAGLGIAMGNADPELKKIAGAVTNHHEENGVAEAIQRFLF